MAEIEDYRIFIKGLSRSINDKSLEDAFSRFGNIIKSWVVTKEKGWGFGFIQFESSKGMEDSISEMNGKELDGKIITVSKAHCSKEMLGQKGGDGGGCIGGRKKHVVGRINCYRCGCFGHYARQCSYAGNDSTVRHRSSSHSDRGDRFKDQSRDRHYVDSREGLGSGGKQVVDRGSYRERPGRPYDRYGKGGGGSGGRYDRYGKGGGEREGRDDR